MRRATVLGPLLALLVAGCAAIPTSGPVREVADDAGLGQSTVRYSPALPAEGAAPADIVRGFLDAMLAYPSSTRTASAFLSPSAAEEWRPQAGVTVYSGAELVVLGNRPRTSADGPEDVQTIPVTIDEDGRLDPRGTFSPGRGGRTVSYRLVQIDGQWRIDDPQAGLMVTQKFFDDYFRPFNLYFFDAPAARLAATPVHLPVDDRLAAALVSGLARGTDVRGLRTFVPPVDALRPTVPVDGGIAEVGFSDDEPSGDSEPDVDRLSAQLVWTLRQVPGLEGVRIGLGPDTLTPTGAGIQPLTAWQEYGPADRSRGYALVNDKVVQLSDDAVAPIAGPWGDDAQGAVGVALTARSVALLRPGRAAVRVAPRTGSAGVQVTGTEFLDPIADSSGRFWLVDRPNGGVRVRVVVDDDVRVVDTSALGRRDLRALDVSPDGSRVVLTTGAGAAARILVAPIVRDRDDVEVAIGRPTRVSVDAAAPRSAVWSDAVRVGFLAGGESAPQVHTAIIDGSATTGGATGGRAVLPEVDGVRLAMGDAPDLATYVLARNAELWHLGSSGTWRKVGVDAASSVGFGP